MHENFTDNTFFDTDTGVSTVEKSNRWGTFKGHAYCSDEDSDIMNRWDGMKIAEFRADMKCAHEKAKAMRQRMIEARHIQSILGNDNEKLNTQVKIAECEYKNAFARYKAMRSIAYEMPGDIVKKRREVRKQIDALSND